MKYIIIYASRHGCTEKAAKLLQEKLTEGTRAVNIEMEKVPDLSSFDTVILGGPVYIGKMHEKLSAYMKSQRDILKTKRLALFICAGEQDPIQRERLLVSAFPEELFACAIMREVFGGELSLKNLSFVKRLLLRFVKGIKEDYARLSEVKIDKFARRICDAKV